MPTYEYGCTSCDCKLEVFQSITASPLVDCPSCGGSSLQRRVGCGSGIIFKGSGFYQTDYRSDSYQKSAKQDSPTKAE